jgi:hypothetical protein
MLSMMAQRPKLKAIDYVVMIGGPLIFLLIFWLGVRVIMGPVPEASPVKKLREGKIAIGSRMVDVEKELGRPNQVVELEDGGYRFVYTRTVYESQTRSDSLDEAVVEFTPTGRVQKISFEQTTPPSSVASPP